MVGNGASGKGSLDPLHYDNHAFHVTFCGGVYAGCNVRGGGAGSYTAKLPYLVSRPLFVASNIAENFRMFD
jgi:hypothetical protein